MWWSICVCGNAVLGRFDEHFVFRKLCEKGYSPTVSMSEHKIFEMVLFDNLNIIIFKRL